jgi:hypothetical protein
MQFERFYRGEKIKIIDGALPKGSRATIGLTPSELKARGIILSETKIYMILLSEELTKMGYGHDCGGLAPGKNGWWASEKFMEHIKE